MTLDDLSDEQLVHLYDQGLIPDHEMERLVRERVSPQDLALIDSLAYGLAKLFSTPIDQLEAEADPFRGGRSWTPENAHNTSVGSILPFLIGLPMGMAGLYFLMKWQSDHPGRSLPGVAPGKYPGLVIPPPQPTLPAKTVGGPWLDLESVPIEQGGYTIGGPWLDIEPMVGVQVDDRARRRAWPQTRALIQSAINEVTASAPSAAYVWSLDPPSAAYYTAQTSVMPFASTADALDYMRARIQTPHVALALFDRNSAHWPNPISWTKSDDPAHEPFIAAQAAKASSSIRASGGTAVGAAFDDVRKRAQTIANKRAGNVVGVIHTTKDGLWHALAFRNTDDADDWLGTSTQEPASYTYAAYFDKDDRMWPHAVNEKTGGPRAQDMSRASAGGW